MVTAFGWRLGVADIATGVYSPWNKVGPVSRPPVDVENPVSSSLKGTR